MSKKVLILEPRLDIQYIWDEQLKNKIEIISATSAQEAQTLFSNTLDALVITATKDDPKFLITVKTFLAEIKRNYTGPIIIASPVEEARKQFVEEGCDYECTRVDLVKTLKQILRLD